MLLISKFLSGFNKFNIFIGRIFSYFTLTMVLVTFLIVILRYGFDIGFIWLQESVRFMYASVFLLCAAYTLGQDGHVRVDVFYLEMNKKNKAIVDFLGSVFFTIPVCMVILLFSIDYVLNSWSQLEGSLEERGLHAVYLLKTCIWAYAIMMIMQSLVIIFNSLNIILKSRKK